MPSVTASLSIVTELLAKSAVATAPSTMLALTTALSPSLSAVTASLEILAVVIAPSAMLPAVTPAEIVPSDVIEIPLPAVKALCFVFN